MKSIVDYEDSDTEDTAEKETVLQSKETQDERVRAISSHINIKRPNIHVFNDCSVTESVSQPAGPNWQPKMQYKVIPKYQSVQTAVSLCSKESNEASAGLRPYVSKRQRLTNQPEITEVQPGGPDKLQVRNQHLLSEVSERIRPFLSKKAGAAELPKRVEHELHAHQGPVNTVRWCPVPQLSHLLLSASMDKTVKVWDGAASGQCLQIYATHSEAVRDACWLPCGRRLLTGSFDNTASLLDVETAQVVAKMDNQFRITCLAIHPKDPTVFLCGGFSSEVKAWDSRICKPVRVYKAGIQQTLDIIFLTEGKEFVTSSDAVSRDSADRTLMAWDFGTTAKISNQIFHERYTCPSLACHRLEESFVAQTNGDYIALFSAQKPYRMNKRKRFKGHKVEGYAVQCDFSADGTILATGSSTGAVYFYDYYSTRTLLTLCAHQQACVGVSYHPVLPAVVATCDWGGEIKIWK